MEDRRRVRAILPYTKVPETDEIRYVQITVVTVKSIRVFLNINNLGRCSYANTFQLHLKLDTVRSKDDFSLFWLEIKMRHFVLSIFVCTNCKGRYLRCIELKFSMLWNMFCKVLDFYQKDEFIWQRTLYGNGMSECVREMS